MQAKVLVLPRKGSYRDVMSLEALAFLLIGFAATLYLSTQVVVVNADNFTDVFYTNSFRGSFEWFKKLDWVGMVVQAVISVFSLVGVALIVIRVMTSMLFLSAKGLWEEVHDLKQSGGESDMYDFGLINMAKTWAKGKAGTGLDAILGAVLVLLPDVKRYSDFGEKSGQKFDEDTSMSQYILKIALPTILAVFFLSMGFNGTLVKGLAVTVDAMGTVADKAVSVNYAGFVDDLIASGSGYKFTFAMDGTNEGKLKESIAKDLYGRVVSSARGANPAQLSAIGQAIESQINDGFATWVSDSKQISSQVMAGFDSGENSDRYYSYLGFEIIANTSEVQQDGTGLIRISEILGGVDGLEASPDFDKIFHIYVKQTNSFDGSYFNVDDIV